MRSIDALKEHAITNGNRNGTTHNDSESQSSFQPKFNYNSPTAKYEAFGIFVASSLTDLPETKALELIEKFTSELVRTLISTKTAASEK